MFGMWKCLACGNVWHVERADKKQLVNNLFMIIPQATRLRNSKFTNSSNVDQFKMLVCPTNHFETKLVSRFLQKQFSERERLGRGDNGVLAL